MAYDTSNVRIGACEVYYNGEHVGHTAGGVTVRITIKSVAKKVDLYGDVAVGYNDLGTDIEVTIPFAEETLANITKFFPTGTNSPADRVTFGRKVGTAFTGYRLVLDPLDGGEPIVIYKAVPNPDETQEIAYTQDAQRVWNVVFKGIPDLNRADGDQLFRIGGPAS